MNPPLYADLDKQCRELFNKSYDLDRVKLECKTNTNGGVGFTAGVNGNMITGKVFGNLETKYKVMDYGATFSEKWNTENMLVTEVAVQDPYVKGLKINLDSAFQPHTGHKSGKLRTEYKHAQAAMNCDIHLLATGAWIHGSGVLGYKGMLAGYQTSFDVANTKITKNNFSLGYVTGEYVLHSYVNNGIEYGGSVYQKVNKQLETGIQFAWSATSNAAQLGIGCKYILNNETSIRAKVNNSSQIALSYQQKLHDGVTVTMSAQLDSKNFKQGGHKIGFGVDLQA